VGYGIGRASQLPGEYPVRHRSQQRDLGFAPLPVVGDAREWFGPRTFTRRRAWLPAGMLSRCCDIPKIG
jgi:hypothetical protein